MEMKHRQEQIRQQLLQVAPILLLLLLPGDISLHIGVHWKLSFLEILKREVRESLWK